MIKKNVLILLSIFIVFSLLAREQKKEETRGFKFDSYVYDYGKIKRKSDGQCIFKFTNVDIVPVVVSNVKTSCGCTSPQWPKQPILPKETAEIIVKYNTKIIGPFTKTITVTSSASQRIVLTIKGEVLK